MAESFLTELNRKYRDKKTLAQSALASMAEYAWPGNVRELKNVLERAFIMCESGEISAGDLGISPRGHAQPEEPAGQFSLKRHLEQVEADYILRAYQSADSLRGAAKSLDMDPATFLRKLRKYDPSRAEDAQSPE
ncbi:Alginate biosynthesis transcriptional regulatory protein AlgB [bioreactor metagenome]|uniref:Alginate biosynthesis transcriptional regulatory protein AlgB n=1 Tax=bioreactor metagenome TaxID=1076179 RepID=A0A645J6C6_9ZZZZ